MENIQERVAKTLELKEDPDSLELGTPSKLGCIKVYGNFNDPESFKTKIDNAISVRQYANTKLNGE